MHNQLPELLAEAARNNPREFRKIAASASTLMQSPVFVRVKRYLDRLTERNEPSHKLFLNGTSLCPIYAALREGAKTYPRLIEALAQAGTLEGEPEGDGVEVEAKEYTQRENE